MDNSKWPVSYQLSGYLKPENVNRPHKDGETLLLRVIWNCFDRISDVLDMGADVTLPRKADGITPLMALSMDFVGDGQEQEVACWLKEFVRRGADIHAKTLSIQDEEGRMLPAFTALMIATSHQSAIAFQTLVELGANLDEKDSTGRNLIEILDESVQHKGLTSDGFAIQSFLEAHRLSQSLPTSLQAPSKASFL